MAPFAQRERHSPFVRQYRTVPGEGPVPARIMLIGERPGEKEAIAGRPFVGPAGEMLDTLLAAANLDRKSIYITNLVKTFAEYGKPTAADVEEWGPVLEKEINQVQPEIIGCLGTYAVEWLLGIDRAELGHTHGVPMNWCNGFDAAVMLPMFHPAAALYTPDTMNNVLDDFLRLAQLADGELTVREDQHAGREDYQRTDNSLISAPVVAIDTEGDRRHPWCLTWSQVPGWARLSKDFMHVLSGKVYLHNSLHDLGVLRAMGIELGEEQFVDTMVLAYQLCIEPQGLKALAYRHCGMHQHDYSELVEEPNKAKALEFMLAILETEWPAPEPYIVLDKGLPKVKKPQGINKLAKRAIRDLAADKRNKDGEPVDLRDRWNKWDDTVKGPVIEVMGEMPVATLDDVDPAKAEWYANRDADATLRIGPILEQKCHDMGLDEAVAVDHAVLPMIDRMQEVGIQLAPVEFWDAIGDECDAQMGRSKYQVYKLTGANINPASGDQVAELLYDQMGLTPPKMTDSGSRGSVNAVALESLLSEAPVVQPIMDYNEANKIKGTYVAPLRKLCQIGDQRAHSTMRVTRTTTGRLSMADPPLHQIPIMTDLGKQLRGGFVAPDGYVIGDWDLDQIEMRLMAHESQDRELCDLFIKGRDVHSDTACKIFSVSMSQLSVGPTGKVNDYRRTVAKHCIAEGELVLTDKGLVPIQSITLGHKLWDGVEWVAHEGVIDQGIREVITHDRLTATPDHKVVTIHGVIETLGEAASKMAGIETTGIGGNPVWTGYRDLLEYSARKRIHHAAVQVHEVRQGELEVERQSDESRSAKLSFMQPYKIGASESSRGKVRCYPSTLQQIQEQELQELRAQGYQVPVQVPGRICEMDRDQSAARGLQRSNNRPEGQRWTLRTGEFETSHSSGAESEYPQKSMVDFQRGTDPGTQFRQPVRSVMDLASSKPRDDRGTDCETCSGALRERREQEVEVPAALVKKARVYDILNAGPRRCFTVSGKLVLNCAFGIINGITEHGLVNYMILNRCTRPDGETWTKDDCVMLLGEWFNIYKGVKRFQEERIAEAQATGLGRESISGRIVYLPAVWSPVKYVRETAQRMSYVMRTQGGAASLIKKCMAVMWKEVFKVRDYGTDPLLWVHDEIAAQVPDDECIKSVVDELMNQILSTTVKLRVPVKASGGYGPNWLAAH